MTTTLAPAPTRYAALTELQAAIVDQARGDGARVPDVVRALGVTGATVYDAVARLVKRGWLLRQEPDHPGAGAVITAAAWVGLAPDLPIVSDTQASVLRLLTTAPREARTVSRLADAMAFPRAGMESLLARMQAVGLIQPDGLVAQRTGRPATAYAAAVAEWRTERELRTALPTMGRKPVFGECANCTCPSHPWEYQIGTVTLPAGSCVGGRVLTEPLRIESATIRTAPCRRDQVAVRELLEGLE